MRLNAMRLTQTLALPLLLACAGAWAQPRYAVADLGILPGHASCTAAGLNNLSQVVGTCAPAVENFNQTGFVWRAGTMTPVGRLPGSNYSTGQAINVGGTVAGDADTGNIRPQGWVDNGGGAVNFFPNKGGNTHVVFLADAGWIGGYYTKSLSGNTSSWKGALWTQDPKDPRRWNLIDLPVLPGGLDSKSSTSIPMAFNQAGQAAGYAMNDQIGQRAAFWQADATRRIVLLGGLPGESSSVAYGLNDLGQAVGSSHPPFASRAVLWGTDAARSASVLAPLPGDNCGSAHAINNLGQILGTSNYCTPGSWVATPARAVIWRDGGVFELQAALDPASGAGWQIESTAAINSLGQIAATAVRAGQRRAVLLVPLN